jgi:hypothetical protein
MFEAYSIGIRIGLINGVSSGLIALARQFRSAEMGAAGLRKELKTIKGLGIVGAGLTVAGLGMFAGLEKTAQAGKEYANQLALMNTLGMKQADVAAAVGKAWQTAYDVPTTSIEGNLKSFRELRSVFGVGRENDAAAMLPIVGRIEGVLTALTGHEQDKVGFDLVKATELRTGLMTMQALQQNAEMMSRAIIGMGGTITVGDFHGALKMGKMATNKWSDSFTYEYLPTLMQEMKTASGGGAQSAGTALMSFYQQAHGRMTKAAMPYWEMGGLVAPKDIVRNAGGQWQVKPGGVKNTSLLESNPYLWVQTTLRPAIDKISDKMHVSAETAINAMFSNRNAAFAAYNMYVKSQQYERDKKTIDQADSYEGYQKLLKTSPQLAEMALAKQWHNLMATIGYQVLPDLMAAIQAILPMIRDATKWANANPGALRAWIHGFEVLAAIFTASGVAVSALAAAKALGLVFRLFGGGGAVAGIVKMAPGMVSAIGRMGGALGALSLVRFGLITAGIIGIGAAINALHKAGGGDQARAGATATGVAAGLNTRDWIGRLWDNTFSRDHHARPAHHYTSDKAGDVYMDGRLVGKIVAGHLVKGLNGPSSGPGTFDATRNYSPAGLPAN